MSTVGFINDILVPISTIITLFTVAYGAYLSMKEYRLKLKAERRLAESAKVETDIKLISEFTKLMPLAHSRKGSLLSEKAIEKIFDNNLFTDEELKNPELLHTKLEKVAIFNIYAGVAEQDAFIAAIGKLGIEHPILRMPVMQALETMRSFKPEMANKYLDLLNDKNIINNVINLNLSIVITTLRNHFKTGKIALSEPAYSLIIW